MPRPHDPTDPSPVDPGPPAPIVEPELAEPDKADVAPPPPPEEVEPPSGRTRAQALPLDVPIALGADGATLTAYSYLREADSNGVLIHLMATADGTTPIDLAQLRLELTLPDGSAADLTLPSTVIEPAQDSWEADLLFALDGTGLAPGESVLAHAFAGRAPEYTRI